METLKSIGKLIGVLFAGLVLLIAWGMYGPVVKNFISPKRVYYTITADLLINDQPVTISGTVECRWVQHAVAPLVTDTSYYRMIGGPVTKRLSDGSGLLLWVGNLCSYTRNKDGVLFDIDPKVALTTFSAIGIAAKARWYLAHLDNVEAPGQIDVYVGPDYFRQPKRRIHLLHLTTKTVSKGRPTEYQNDIPWLRTGFFGLPSAQPFLGYFARVIPRDTWEQNAQLSKFLSAAKTPIRNVEQALSKAGISKGLSLVNTGGKVIPMTYDGYDLNLSTGDLDKTWTFTLTAASFKSAVPDEVANCYGRFMDQLWPVPKHHLSIDGHAFVTELGNAKMIFDPASGLMINIGSLCIKPGQSFFTPD